MTEQLHQRAAAIRQTLRKHPKRGADLLMNFARRFAANPQVEDDVILHKVRLSSALSTAEKQVVIDQMEQVVDAIVRDYNPDAVKAHMEKESALAKVIRRQLPPDDLVLTAKNIVKRYASSDFTLRLDHLELRLGQITGLVGENATGKTTLIRILAGDLAADSGTLQYPLFDPAHKLDWPRQKEQIAYVPQELQRWHGALRDNLSYEAALHGIKGTENRKAVDYIVQRLGLALHLDKDWTELSGGYKLRFALAKALVWKAKLLIIDEPLAFLDVKTQLVVLNDLQNLAKSLRHPMAVIISSQHLHETESVADQMLFMRDGHLENLGKTIDLGAKRKENTFELDCPANYNELQQALEKFPHFQIWNIGMHWIVTTPLSVSGSDLLQHLSAHGITVNYYRDLSRSVKTKFYEGNL